jgi:selenocysteine-specific elongation factor
VGLVVGTAGHIDHGKTSLVYALTGVDTDRLKEEKRRGISIDLGFARMQLPNGPVISFVDVPGHERFVRNMLAGAAGMEAVLLIVAANESVMPQTREHFEICQLLGLRHGLIVLTKCDLATAAQLAQTRLDVQALVAGSFLANAPLLEVSVVTHVGLAELTRHLALVVSNETGRNRNGVVRMPIDRSFAVKGFGTVVTGTLLAGSVSAGETLDVLPSGLKVRVRGLQAQHASVQQASAGQRLAVNLAGIEQQAVQRGHMLASANALAPSRLIDVELRWLDLDALPSARELFVLHAGTAESSVRITLHRNANAPLRFARLRLAEEVVALPGDRFVIRRPSPAQTVGGGVVIDAFPPKRMNRAKTLARLEALSTAAVSRRIELLVDESANGRSIAELVRMMGLSREQLQAAIGSNDGLVMSANDRVVTRQWIAGKRQALVAWLRDFHKANPNAAGAPLAASRLGIDAALTALIFKDFEALRIQGETVALATHNAQFTPREVAALQNLEQAFRMAAFQPPSVAEAIAASGLEVKKARALLESLLKANRLVRLPGDLVFHADVIAHIRTSLAQQKGRRFSVVEFKAWTNVSRKFAIPLLEYLDQQRVTRREGEVRVVL